MVSHNRVASKPLGPAQFSAPPPFQFSPVPRSLGLCSSLSQLSDFTCLPFQQLWNSAEEGLESLLNLPHDPCDMCVQVTRQALASPADMELRNSFIFHAPKYQKQLDQISSMGIRAASGHQRLHSSQEWEHTRKKEFLTPLNTSWNTRLSIAGRFLRCVYVKCIYHRVKLTFSV